MDPSNQPQPQFSSSSDYFNQQLSGSQLQLHLELQSDTEIEATLKDLSTSMFPTTAHYSTSNPNSMKKPQQHNQASSSSLTLENFHIEPQDFQNFLLTNPPLLEYTPQVIFNGYQDQNFFQQQQQQPSSHLQHSSSFQTLDLATPQNQHQNQHQHHQHFGGNGYGAYVSSNSQSQVQNNSFSGFPSHGGVSSVSQQSQNNLQFTQPTPPQEPQFSPLLGSGNQQSQGQHQPQSAPHQHSEQHYNEQLHQIGSGAPLGSPNQSQSYLNFPAYPRRRFSISNGQINQISMMVHHRTEETQEATENPKVNPDTTTIIADEEIKVDDHGIPKHQLIYNNEIIFNPDGGPIPGTSAWKRQKILERNRVAASKCRQKKKVIQEKLQQDVNKLTDENLVLIEKNAYLEKLLLSLKKSVLSYSAKSGVSLNQIFTPSNNDLSTSPHSLPPHSSSLSSTRQTHPSSSSTVASTVTYLPDEKDISPRDTTYKNNNFENDTVQVKLEKDALQKFLLQDDAQLYVDLKDKLRISRS